MATDTDLLIRIRADVRQALGEVRQVRQDISGLGHSGKTAASGLQRTSRAAEHTSTRLSRLDRRAVATTMSLKNLARTVAVAFAIHEIMRFTRSLVDANMAAQRIEYTLQAVTGSAEGARREFRYLVDLSNRLGLDLRTTAAGYARLAVSAQSAGITQQQLREGFEGLAETFTVLHTPAEDVNGLLVQLEQGMSLGKLQMQDFRAIAQHMPGTFELVKEATERMGGSLADMLEHGGVPAKEFFEQFTALLHDKYGPEAKEASHSLNAELNRLHTTIFGLQTQPSGFVEGFTDALRELNETLSDPGVQAGFATLVTFLGKVISLGAKAIGTVGELTSEIGQGLAIAATRFTELGGEASPFPFERQIQRTQIDLEQALARRKRLVANLANVTGTAIEQTVQNEIRALDAKIPELKEKIDHLKRLQMDAMTPPKALAATATEPGNAGDDSPLKSPQAATSLVTDRAVAQIKSVIGALKQQAVTYGQTAEQVQLYRLQTLGATDAQIAQAKALIDAIQQKKDDAAATQAQAQAEADLVKQLDAKHERQAQQARDILDQLDPSRVQARQVEQAKAQAQALVEVHRLTQEQAKAYVQLVKQGQDATDEMNQFAIQAARNVQDALAETFQFNKWNDGFRGLVHSWANALEEMAAQALAAKLGEKLLGKGFTTGKSSNVGGWVGTALSFAASFMHDGGIVGASAGRTRRVPASVFADAPRFHGGGFPGLAPDEVPIIAQRGERVLSRDEVAQGQQQPRLRIVNVIDPAIAHDYLTTPAGEELIVNTIRRNAGAVRGALG